MTAAPPISIVIPARNESARIGRCLASIRRSLDTAGLAGVELVVVDDQSSDGTAGLAQSEGALVLRQAEHEGRTAAWLRGVEETSGAVLVFVDADCEVGPESFAQLLRAMARPEVGVVAGRSLPLSSAVGSRVVGRSARFTAVLLHQIKVQLKNHDFLPIGRLMAVRRTAWKVEDGSLQPCDRVVANLARRAGWEVVYAPGAEVFYEPITSFRALREDYLRTGVVRAKLPVGRDPLASSVKVRAALRGASRSPVDASAWAACRTVLVLQRALAALRGAWGSGG